MSRGNKGSARRGDVCAYPGCGSFLIEGATTGLCRKHAHTKGLCPCERCARIVARNREKRERDERRAKQGITVVHVQPETGANLSDNRARVSLKIPPWET